MTVPENHIPLLMYTLLSEDYALSRRGRGAAVAAARPRHYTNRYSLRYHHLRCGSDSAIRPNLPFPSVPEARSIWIMLGAGDAGDGTCGG